MLIHPTWVLRSISFLRFSLFVIRKIRVLGRVESLSVSNWWGLLILSQLCALCYYIEDQKINQRWFRKTPNALFLFVSTTYLFCLAAGILLVGYTHSGAKLSNLLGGIGNFTNEMRNYVLRNSLPRLAWWSAFLNTYL